MCIRDSNEVEHYEAELAASTKRLEEARARAKARKAAEDTQRWKLAGQCAVDLMQAEPDSPFFKKMLEALDRHVRSASDRTLFGLPAKAAANGASHPDKQNAGGDK